jgi:integrase
MDSTKGNLLSLLTGGSKLKNRVQHPEVHERKDRGTYYWFFRYRLDEIQPDGTVKTTRPFKTLGPSRGPNGMTITKARQDRDTFLAEVNAAKTRPQAAVAAHDPAKAPEPGDIVFGPLAELWKTDYVERIAAGRHLIGARTRDKYHWCLGYILPRWKDTRLKDLKAKEIMDWLQNVCTSWHGMCGLRNAMSGIITKATEWEIIPRSYANPIQWVKLPKKWEVYEKRILSPEETACVMGLLEEPNLLICETCLDTGTRISEVTGLMIKHVDLDKGTIRIEQRHCRGDIDVPKTAKSKRTLTLGDLTARYGRWIASLKRKSPNDWVFPQEEDQTMPRWDSGVRKALKDAARAVKPENASKDDLGLDFKGFGPHSLRRANITWRQDVGGSSIEASKIAGHSKVETTLDYTIVGLKRQDDLTRRIQDKRAKAARKIKTPVGQPPVSEELAAQRIRARTARTARKKERRGKGVKIGKEDAA